MNWIHQMLALGLVVAAGARPMDASATQRALGDIARFEQKIGSQLPLDIRLVDTRNHVVSLGRILGKRPAVLMFGYFNCPQLCGVTLDGVFTSLRELAPSIGSDYDFVYISIDPEETLQAAQQAKAFRIRRYGRGDDADDTGWHLLRGDRDALAAVADAAGFRYAPVPGVQQFAHAAGFLVVRPDGVVSSYFPGLDFKSAEIAAALRSAAKSENGSPVYNLVLRCFTGGGRTGNALLAFRLIQIAAGLTVGAGAFGIVRLMRSERRSRHPQPEGGSA